MNELRPSLRTGAARPLAEPDEGEHGQIHDGQNDQRRATAGALGAVDDQGPPSAMSTLTVVVTKLFATWNAIAASRSRVIDPMTAVHAERST